MEITIRKATIEDLPGIIELASEAIVHSISPYRSAKKEDAVGYRRKDLKELEYWAFNNMGGYIFVAEGENKEICGHVIMAMGKLDVTGQNIGWILDITVGPNFRGTGISQKLHEVAEALLEENKVGGICLTVTSSNKRAVNFYKKLNYKEEHVQLVKMLD